MKRHRVGNRAAQASSLSATSIESRSGHGGGNCRRTRPYVTRLLGSARENYRGPGALLEWLKTGGQRLEEAR